MNTNQQELRPGDEEALQGLLREMAPEAEPAPEVRERIRQAVAAEWRASVARGPELRLSALAAACPGAGGGAGRRRCRSRRPAVRHTSSGAGHGHTRDGSAAPWKPVLTPAGSPSAAGQALGVGQQLVTGPRGKAALTLARGVTLRLDADTRIALAGIDRVVVERGAVYLDSGNRPVAGPGLRLESSFGSTQHLGTQYEVRVTAGRRCRSACGKARWHSPTGSGRNAPLWPRPANSSPSRAPGR